MDYYVTQLDTERLYTVATQNILDGYGKTYTWEVKASVMGMQSHEMAQTLVTVYELPMTPDEYLDRAKEQYDDLMPFAELLPGNYQIQQVVANRGPAFFFLSQNILADTEKIYYSIIEDVLKQFNKPYPWTTRMRVLGTTEMNCCQIVVDDCKLPIDAKEFHKRFTKLGNERMDNCDLLPGLLIT